VRRGIKIGDIDPRDDPRLCALVSDKALSLAAACWKHFVETGSARPIMELTLPGSMQSLFSLR